jgi:hypothetical integral membrane protein (TIGR02206 family)
MQIDGHLHLVMIFVTMGLAFGALARGRRVTNSDVTGQRLGATLFALWLLYNLYYFQPANFAWERSIPLQVCDILAVVAAAVLVRPFRLGRAILYFSAIPLTSQAVLTPTGNQNPAEARFWLYWGLHAGIIVCSLYDVAVNGYRPTFRDFLLVVVVDLIYVAAILPLDIALGWNYGYLGPGTPEGSTIIDVLGPWPRRVVLMVFIVAGLQFIMLALWHLVHCMNATRSFQRAT